MAPANLTRWDGFLDLTTAGAPNRGVQVSRTDFDEAGTSGVEALKFSSSRPVDDFHFISIADAFTRASPLAGEGGDGGEAAVAHELGGHSRERRRLAPGLSIVLALSIGLAGLVLPGCTHAGVKEVRGVLLDVQSREIQHAESVTLRDHAGEVRTFRVSREVANDPEQPATASHLRQHMLLADPVIVQYRETPEGPLAVRILDVTGP